MDYEDLGLTGITLIQIDGLSARSDEVIFTSSDGRRWSMYHEQVCCESVEIEEIVGDISDLLGTPILLSEWVSDENPTGGYESATWTFYKFHTVKGDVMIRWLGISNGYYSESVSFEKSDSPVVPAPVSHPTKDEILDASPELQVLWDLVMDRTEPDFEGSILVQACGLKGLEARVQERATREEIKKYLGSGKCHESMCGNLESARNEW